MSCEGVPQAGDGMQLDCGQTLCLIQKPVPAPWMPWWTQLSKHPFPGDYFPEKSTKHVFDSAPSHSISARTKTFRVDSTPGPPPPVGQGEPQGRSWEESGVPGVWLGGAGSPGKS